MLLLLSYIAIYFWIKKEISHNELWEKRTYWICTTIGIILAIIYRTFLIEVGIEHGLANLDMKYYVSLAERVSNLPINTGFSVISNHWNFIEVNPIQIWGYRLYIYYLSFTIYRWNILSVDTSIYLISFLQVGVANLSTLIIYNTVKERYFRFNCLSFIFMLIAPPVWFGSVRILREAWIYLCIAEIIRQYCWKQRTWIIKLLLLAIFLTIMRPYYTVFMFPLCLLLDKKTRVANYVNFFILGGIAAICIHLDISISTILGVVFSPNFFNQVHQLNVSAISSAVLTGRIPIVNYIGSLWNLIMIAFAIMAFMNFRKRSETICSLAIIINVCMVYAIAFDGITELRHKMFFVIPYTLMLNNGLDKLKDNKSIELLLVVLILFLSMYSLIVLLIGG